MIKSLILVLSLVISGMAQADYDLTQDTNYEVEATGAEDVLGGILIGAIIGKIIKDKHDKKKHQPTPHPVVRRVRIPIHGELSVGPNTIYLRSELNQMGVNLYNRRLTKVILVAKSQHGQGTAFLQLGNNTKPTKSVAASKYGYPFHSEARESYNEISWNANRPSDDIWQIHLRGRIKVKDVIVELQ